MMETFIANMIIKAAETNGTKGQEKYRAYFVKTRLYARYRENTDTILTTSGYEDCVVTE